MRLGIGGRVGRDERQVARIGQLDQRRLRRLLDRIAAPAELDIEAAREQRFEPLGHRVRRVVLPLGDAGGRARLRRPPVSAISPSVRPSSASKRDMRVLLDRPVEMRRRDQRAEIVIAGLVLRVERQPVDQRRLASVRRARPRHAEQRADDRLHALLEAGVGERHRA